MIKNHISSYVNRLTDALNHDAISGAEVLALSLLDAWRENKSIYICGNGGSAGNAIHLANDFIYGAGRGLGKGLRVEALSANPAVLTCLANDVGYDQIFAEQIRVKGQCGDLLLVLSGSGNSPNIVKALEVGGKLGLKTFAILGFDGGKSKQLAQFPIHFPVQDMQIAEDLQLIVGHNRRGERETPFVKFAGPIMRSVGIYNVLDNLNFYRRYANRLAKEIDKTKSYTHVVSK